MSIFLKGHVFRQKKWQHMSLEEKYLKTQLKKENCIDTGIFDNFRFPKNEFSVTFKRVEVFSKLIVAL